MTCEEADRSAMPSDVEARDPKAPPPLGTVSLFLPSKVTERKKEPNGKVTKQIRRRRENPPPGLPEAKVREMLGLLTDDG